MLKKRIITAFILIPTLLAAIYFFSAPIFCILTGLITLAAAWEWTNLMQIKKIMYRFFYLALMIALFFVLLSVPVTNIFLISSIWWIVALGLVVLYPRVSSFYRNRFALGIMGFLVLIPCWAAINFIRIQEHGFIGLLFLFALVWGADSGAYFVGKKWGKLKLAPVVSPGKTLEGTVGAFFTIILITIVGLLLCHIPVSEWGWALLLAFVTVFFSIVGDLFESLVKRMANVKDSGNLLPGHGGLLDRIDSLTAAAPIYVACGLLLSTYLQ